MIIDKTAFEACLAHLIACARISQEGLGLLAAPITAPAEAAPGLITNRSATWWVPLANVAEFPRVRYEADPGQLLAAYEDLEAEGLRPTVLVHSHLTGGALPSPHDVRYAADPSLLHLIVDLEPQRPHPVLWRLAVGEEPLKIRYRVADLRKQETSAEDLTRGVTEV